MLDDLEFRSRLHYVAFSQLRDVTLALEEEFTDGELSIAQKQHLDALIAAIDKIIEKYKVVGQND